MCWSATADLVAGTGIAAIGVACVARVRRVRDLPLAALPLLLGAHQIIESVIWRSGGGTGPATLAWAVIALPLLPLWVPLGVLWAAPPGARRRLLVPVAAGIATAVPLGYCLATRPVTAEIRGHTLGYALGLPRSGLLVAVGAALCVALWRLESVSTWCAFAAVCSVILLCRPRPDPASDRTAV
ncbi:DUF6629 family protein [Streptomyces sp. NPDC059802]|uniref:DUF6629 family protein n=1 Tax=Streptomyces sp. NPDC059802 TaxID=3346952 RepID=UPI003647A94D